MLQLAPYADGILLVVRAQPGARRNGITGIHAGALKVAVRQAAEKGKANQAVIAVLCDELGLRPAQIELHSGATNRQKRFIIRNITTVLLQQKIAEALQQSN
jgi:uncharacterized protein